MKRQTRTFEIDVHSESEFQYYLSGGDRLVVLPIETDIEKGDIFLINLIADSKKQCACFIIRVAQQSRMNDTYKLAYLNSIYPE